MWWSLGDFDGIEGLPDALYFSGVVFFTVGFGEIVPTGGVPRFALDVAADHCLVELIPFDQARAETLELRRKYDAQLEFLIDYLMTPRGFWGHAIGCKLQDGSVELMSTDNITDSD